MITNLRYADDIILLATSEAELQESVDRLDQVSRKYSLLINVDKTKVMASDGIACRILIQNELLEQSRQSDGRIDRQTDARPFLRPCCAYYTGSINKITYHRTRQLHVIDRNSHCRTETSNFPKYTTSHSLR